MTLISIIIPAYNEEQRISATLDKIISYTNADNFYNYEIIVVDDGSKDNTTEIVGKYIEQFNVVRLVKQVVNQGKGAAVRRGMLDSKGDLLLFSDADLSTPIEELTKLIEKIKSGNDIAIGSRALNNDLIREHQPFYREIMGKTFNKIVQFLVIKGIFDTQCGFKLFTKEVGKKVFGLSKIDGFSFDVEVLYLASKLNYKISEVPVLWFNDDRSKVNPITDSIKMLNEIFKIKSLHKSTKFNKKQY